MYRDTDLQNCLFGLVGFQQNVNPDYPTLPASLVASSSGLYFQQEHPLVNLENLDQAFKNYDLFNFPAYAGATDYLAGERVRAVVDGKVYEALIDTTGAEPSASPDDWKEVPLFAQRLDSIVRGSISKLLASIFIKKKLNQVTKAIFDNIQLFDGAGSLLNKEIKSGRFVGFQVVVEAHRDLITVIKRLGTQFSAANPDFDLYVYHSSQEDPVKIYNLNLTKVNSFQWSPLSDEDGELTLKYLSDDYAPGGCFYIGYYEDDLQGQAINRDYDFAAVPCQTCNNSYRYWSRWSEFVGVTPIEVPSSALVGILPDDVDGPKLWDINRNQYQYTKSYGLNFDMTARCDVTDFFCREKYLFAEALTRQVTVDLLQELAYGTRNNVIAKEVRDLAIYSLNNKDNNTPGAVKRLDMAIDAISFDLSDLNEACLPCNDKAGSTWSSVG
jgi:hypothetical protein